jgi:hypothetical protein
MSEETLTQVAIYAFGEKGESNVNLWKLDNDSKVFFPRMGPVKGEFVYDVKCGDGVICNWLFISKLITYLGCYSTWNTDFPL